MPAFAIQLDALQQWQLRGLITADHPTVEAVLQELVARATEGARRAGSWEGEWIRQIFPDAHLPSGSHYVAHAYAWERPASVATADYPAGWIGRVCSGDDTVLWDSPVQASEQAALDLARQWLREHPECRPVEVALRDPDDDPEDDCDCEWMVDGEFNNAGVPGVIARIVEGKLVGRVERCDACCRYESDEAARRKLIELGLIPAEEPTA